MNHNDIIEEATKVMHAEVCCPCDPQGCDWTHTREASYSRALANAGLLARPLPSKEELEDTILNAMREPFSTYCDVADAVLDLLKGQER